MRCAPRATLLFVTRLCLLPPPIQDTRQVYQHLRCVVLGQRGVACGRCGPAAGRGSARLLAWPSQLPAKACTTLTSSCMLRCIAACTFGCTALVPVRTLLLPAPRPTCPAKCQGTCAVTQWCALRPLPMVLCAATLWCALALHGGCSVLRFDASRGAGCRYCAVAAAIVLCPVLCCAAPRGVLWCALSAQCCALPWSCAPDSACAVCACGVPRECGRAVDPCCMNLRSVGAAHHALQRTGRVGSFHGNRCLLALCACRVVHVGGCMHTACPCHRSQARGCVRCRGVRG